MKSIRIDVLVSVLLIAAAMRIGGIVLALTAGIVAEVFIQRWDRFAKDRGMSFSDRLKADIIYFLSAWGLGVAISGLLILAEVLVKRSEHGLAMGSFIVTLVLAVWGVGVLSRFVNRAWGMQAKPAHK